MQAGLNDLQQCDNVGPGGHEDCTRLQTPARANTACECFGTGIKRVGRSRIAGRVRPCGILSQTVGVGPGPCVSQGQITKAISNMQRGQEAPRDRWLDNLPSADLHRFRDARIRRCSDPKCGDAYRQGTLRQQEQSPVEDSELASNRAAGQSEHVMQAVRQLAKSKRKSYQWSRHSAVDSIVTQKSRKRARSVGDSEWAGGGAAGWCGQEVQTPWQPQSRSNQKLCSDHVGTSQRPFSC
jgi:hypothetical protein